MKIKDSDAEKDEKSELSSASMALLIAEKKEREELEKKLKEENALIEKLRKETEEEKYMASLSERERFRIHEKAYNTKAAAELEALRKAPVKYPVYDPHKDKPQKGYYFPILDYKVRISQYISWNFFFSCIIVQLCYVPA